ncbi:hypothetical protein ABPG72_014000 [Tetrahymena utriculariae]
MMEIEEQKTQSSTNKRLSEGKRWMVLGLYEANKSQTETADHFGINQSTVSRIIGKYFSVGDVQDFKRVGRDSKMDLEDSQTFEELIKEDRFITTEQIGHKTGVSTRTVKKYIPIFGFKFSIPEEIPQLNAHHISKRLSYATQFKDTDEKSIIFTDETYFQLFRNTKGVWHKNTEQNVTMKPQTKVCLMAYGAISWNGRSSIYIYPKGFKVDSESYVKILEEVLIPFAEKSHENQRGTRSQNNRKKWYLVQDNAPCHKSKFTTNFINHQGIQILPHPPNSPDLNPIELIWSVIKSRIEKENPQNEQQLRQVIQQQWDDIEQDIIHSCILHYKKRLKTVFELNGKYN